MRGTISLCSLLAATAGACVDLDDDATDDAADRQTFSGSGQVLVLGLDPKPPATPPAPLVTDGTYQLSSTLDVEAQQLLPGTAYEAVQILQGLRDNPAMTLFDLAEEGGVPAVGTIRDALPSALESRLYGWINGYVWGVTTGDGTIAQVIDAVLAAAQTDVGYVQLESTLSVNGGIGQHRLDNVSLEVAGRAYSYDVAPLAGVGFALDVPVTATVSADNQLAIGAHTFGFPYGKLVWRVIEEQVSARYGTDLRGLLGRQVDCAGMAAYVASRCYLGVCVGHESDLNSVCEAGLDYAVAKVREKVESASVDPIALDAGTASMHDWLLTDNVCETIDGGVWDARLDIGNGLRSAPATFTGLR